LPLLVLAYPLAGANAPLSSAVFYALALAFNYPHYMATVYRAYRTREDFDRYRLFTVYVTGILALTLILAHVFYRMVPWLFTLYVTWSPWHYMGQNFGLMMLFIHRSGVRIDRKDRNALWVSFVASYCMIFLAFHANPSADPYVVSLGLPALVDVLRVPLLFIFLILGIYPLGKLTRRVGWRPMLAPMVLFTTEFLWFVLPTVVELLTGLRIPQTRYSAGILAVMHSAQYLWITSYYARQEAIGSRATPWRWRGYLATLAVGGIALFVPGPWLASYVLGRDFGSSVLIFAAVINIHHFILDGAIWKLREPKVASLLIGSDRGKGRAKATPWLRPPGWRWTLPAATAILLLLAAIDQVRYDLGLRVNSGASLAMAAVLNPNDAALQTRLGLVYAASGQKDQTEKALRESVRLNPYSKEAHNALLRFLVEEERYDAAYTSYRNMMSYGELDAPGLVNFGMLCFGRGKFDEGVRSMESAIEKSPAYAPAHLYLGKTLLAAGKIQDALATYKRCEDVAKRAGSPDLAAACGLRASELQR
jgi:hypothetical protein